MLLLIYIQLVFLLNGYAPLVHASNGNLCHAQERDALLEFISAFTIGPDRVSPCRSGYAKTETWKKNKNNSTVDGDCCLWDGVTCDPITGHVTELDLSCTYLTGAFPSNTTLFRLRRLRRLNLAYNNFLAAPIPPGLGRLSDLTHLNLSESGIACRLPDEIFANLTRLREIDLSGAVGVGSALSPMIGNLSELETLRLARCGLTGEFPVTSALSLPALRVLDVGGNRGLHGEFSLEEWRGPLEVVDFSYCSFTGELPESVGVNGSLSLRSVNVERCSFHGRVPSWMWNVTEEIRLSFNFGLFGSLPTSVNTTTLARLSMLQLEFNLMTGTIPAWAFSLPSLKTLHLQYNLFTEIEGFTNASSSLVSFQAYDNQLRGQLPDAIFKLRNLQELSLQLNSLNGTIFLSQFRKLSNNLRSIGLSDNEFTVIDDLGDDDIASWPNLENVALSYCNLGHFPRFLRERENLKTVMLANNGIRGHVPAWVFDVATTSWITLDISSNSLTGGLSHLPWRHMHYIDISSNMFEGAIPAPSPSVTFFWASKNRFTGEIPSFLCNLDSIQLLDLSHNNFTGKLPKCLASPINKSLLLLDLQQNRLQGEIPSLIFENCPSLYTLSLSGNQLEGPIPQSLNHCASLGFLDLGKNKLMGAFPHWLGNLSYLQLLILGSNELQGPLKSSNMTASPFSSLRILDISNNYFTGGLSGDLLTSFKAMMDNTSGQYLPPYNHQIFYYDSIVARFKGLTRELDEIFADLVSIDASNNRLEGHIPEAIGDLVTLRWLNLAHNNFTGNIPTSLVNLRKLESLDLSSNKLEGQIPGNLVDLTSLEFFNVSENNLVGRVPSTKQFVTFTDSSYLGNPGLCGDLLTKKCRPKDEWLPNSTTTTGSEFKSSDFHVWEIVLMGCGCGMFIGSFWGYFVVWERNYSWVSKLIIKMEGFIMVRRRRQRRRQNRRGN